MNVRAQQGFLALVLAFSSLAIADHAPQVAHASPRQLQVTAWTGVSCSGGCSRAGYYDDPITGTRRSRLQISQGVGAWIIDELGGGTGLDSQYNAISCPQPAGCAAVGTATNAAGSTPIINAGVPLKSKGASSGANGVSCPSTTFCMMVGWFRSASGVTKTLTEVADPSFWKVVASPNVGALPMMLNAVSCTSRTYCVAVGYVGNAAVPEQPYALQWNGVSWLSMPLPVVNTSHTIRLNGVSCTSPTFCMAVGSETSITRGTIQFRWDGSAWTRLHASTDFDIQSSDFEFNAVSCGATDLCAAVGSERGASRAGLAEAWDGVSWSHNPSPGPRPVDNLYAAACSIGGCAVGGTQTLSDNVAPIGVFYSLAIASDQGSPPMMVNTTRGDGWMNIEWIAPLSAGPDPIIGYRMTTYTSTGADGPNFDVGADTRSVTLPDTAALHPRWLYALTLTAAIGPSYDPMLFFGGPVTGPVNISTDWEASELPRLQQSADYLSMTTSQFQHDAVNILAFILSLSPPSGSTPISGLIVDAGPTTITSAWPVADQPLLVNVTNQYGLSPSQSQKFAAELIGYLLSLGGN